MTEKKNQPESGPVKKKSKRIASVSIIFTIVMMVVFVLAFGFGYFQLSKINISIAKTVNMLDEQAKESKQEIADLQKAMTEMQQATAKSQSITDKQSKMIHDWQDVQQGNLSKWYVAEAEYLVRLANDHMIYTHDSSMALTLLQRAYQVLDKVPDQSMMPIRQSIVADITKLKATPQIDITQLYMMLTALDAELDKLPLPAAPLQHAQDQQAAKTAPDENVSWWRRGLNNSWHALSKVVVVRYNGAKTLPLVMPEERRYLYQNLHNQVQSAIWASLHGNWKIYQTSLVQATKWIEQYFDMNAAETQATLQQLKRLSDLNVKTPKVDIAKTLQLLENYMSQSTQHDMMG